MFSSQIKPLFERLKYQDNATALINQQGIYSFAELGLRTAAIAQVIAPWAGRNVLVHGHKQLDAVAALLACISQGSCFTFVDQSNPLARVEKIANLTRAELILTATTHKLEGLDRWPQWVTPHLENGDPASLPLEPELTQPAFYILPTSGSTGEPKGVVVSYENFAAFSTWYSPMISDDIAYGCHVSHACFSFDMGLLDLFPVLCQGRALLMLDHCHNMLPRQNIRLMSRYPQCPATSWFSTPSFVDLILRDPLFNRQEFPELKRFFMAGERASLGLVNQLQTRFPGLEVMHGYGPTETTGMTHTFALGQPPEHNAGLLSLGKPCGLTRIRIVDADGHSLAPGEMGEVRLYGPQVALGYQPEDDPRNNAFSHDEFGRYYATGDRGFLDDDQALFIHGRDDNQLKVNGNRVELAEIESSVCRYGEVIQCCVVPIKDEGKVTDLQLFIQLREDNATHRDALRQFLAEQLPGYMIPKSIFFCQTFPVTLHGKIDRQQLVHAHKTLSDVS
ncbi:AMP-binding protein [Pseudomonas sp. MWU15-20650]|uniref:AMP-binding protein n=1 Tax=Pseudomonas sp. MWU15-20650 TaxID=2933107 RepID=UPI00200D7291|nr:AMP-binding protein [Pseudomonas sp. MWU15-20650]